MDFIKIQANVKSNLTIIKQPWRSKEGQATKDGGLFSLECKEWKDDNLYPPRPTLNPFFPIHFSLNIHDHIGS